MHLTGKQHQLKCWPEFFQAIVEGRKPFDVRVDDRHFNVGDSVLLQEFDPRRGFTGREHSRLITYVLSQERQGVADLGWELPLNVVVLGYGVGCRL